jgi:hypothetical protein
MTCTRPEEFIALMEEYEAGAQLRAQQYASHPLETA